MNSQLSVQLDDYIYVIPDPQGIAWQGYVDSFTSDSITLINWCAWHMGDNRPTEGQPNETLTLTVAAGYVLVRSGEDDDVVVSLPTV